jgi:leader peptidase (prepilin peptidase) / N-methyltransferase
MAFDWASTGPLTVAHVSSSVLPVASGSLAPFGWSLAAGAFVFGLCVGSFLNVCIHRLPADESVVHPRSRCPHCGTPIAWFDNVPILSWLVLAARCRTCNTAIPARYPLVEAATGGLAVLALAHFGPTPAALVAFAFTAALLLVTFIDLDHKIIPDEISKPGIAIGLAASFLPGHPAPLDAVVGAVAGGGVLWLVAWVYERATGIEGMGFGDVKLLAMIGAFVGWQALPAILLVSSVTGSLVGIAAIAARTTTRARRVARRLGPGAVLPYARRTARRTEIPFGPFLALAGALAFYRADLRLPWSLQ